MGIAAADALGAIRLSIGRDTRQEHVDGAADLLVTHAATLADGAF